MVVLNADHQTYREQFIQKCKEEEEKKAWALIDAGYDGSLDGPAYSSVYFQNANNSVRVTDDFMQARRSTTANGRPASSSPAKSPRTTRRATSCA